MILIKKNAGVSGGNACCMVMLKWLRNAKNYANVAIAKSSEEKRSYIYAQNV